MLRVCVIALSLLSLMQPLWSQDSKLATEVFDMRGDQGLLKDFGPTGVAWMPDGRLFVVDRVYNCFHIFDTRGRRFRFLDFPVDTTGLAWFNGLARFDGKVLYAIGSHFRKGQSYHLLNARSVLDKVELSGEQFTADSCKENYSPDTAWRATGYYGDSAAEKLEVSGITMDRKHNRVFVSCSRPLAPDGTLLILTGELDKLLKKERDFRFELVKTGIKPEMDAELGAAFACTDLEYVPDKGLVLLLNSSSGEDEATRGGSSQLWFLKAGFGPGKLLCKGLFPDNRATGLSFLPEGKWNYTAALVCDNAMEQTGRPSRLGIIKGIQLPLK